MFLTGEDIFTFVIGGEQTNINPASYDLRLGNTLRKPRWWWSFPVTRTIAWRYAIAKGLTAHLVGSQPNPMYWTKPFSFTTYTLFPGKFVLAGSVERTSLPSDVVGFLISKSSAGRRGMGQLHTGFGDPGFRGVWTFEIVNNAPWPIILKAGSRLMQVAFAKMEKDTWEYNGKYQDQTEPTPSREPR